MKEFEKDNQVLVFERGGLNFAVPLSNVIKVIAAQEITPVASINKHLSGIINYKGEIIPVITLDNKFCLETKTLKVQDKIILTRYQDKPFAIIADNADQIISINVDSVTNMDERYAGLAKLSVADFENNIIIIYDPSTIFSDTEIIGFIQSAS